MTALPPNIVAFIASGSSILNAEGLLLELCTEHEIDITDGLSQQQRNALKMVVRKRALPAAGEKT